MFINPIDSRAREENSPLLVAEAGGCYRPASDVEILNAAELRLLARVHHGPALQTPTAVKEYLRIRMGTLPHEEFVVLYLDSHHRLLHAETLFRGTLGQTSVYPRELAIGALRHEAAAVMVAHNHPSGDPTPSRADQALTQTLKTALAMLDIRLLDHFIVTPMQVLSLAEQGLV